MGKFTCISCGIELLDADIMRSHYKTDWHRYNLKRKVLELPPVSSEDFQARVISLRKAEEPRDDSVLCKICRKPFASSKSFHDHINSKKHKLALQRCSEEGITEEEVAEKVLDKVKKEPVQRRMELMIGNRVIEDEDDDSEWDDVDDSDCEDEGDMDGDVMDFISEGNPILLNNCLFCDNHSKTMTKNLKHMSVEHSFFIPDLDYITDLRGLLLYLGEKVCKYFLCLWCNLSGRGFYSMEAAQTHMRDKGHCKMKHEGDTLLEFSCYYNYAKSYPDYDESMDVDEEINLDELNLDGGNFELKLPSGATIGHRSLALYYKQHFNPNQQIVTRNRGASQINKLMCTYRALGWKSEDKTSVARKARDIQFMNQVKSKFFQKVGVKANKLQKHFRPQVMF